MNYPQKAAAGPGKSPRSQVARRKRLGIIGFTIVVVLIPFCLYFLFFVTSQTTYFSKRNFRVLAGIADHISLKIDNLATNLVNVIKNVEGKQTASTIADPQTVKKAVALVPGLTFDDLQYEQATARKAQESKVKAALPVSNGTNGEASPPAVNTNVGSPGATSQRENSAAAAADATDSEPPPVTLNVKPERGSFWLYLECRSASSALPGILPVKSKLNTLIEPFVEKYVIDELNETRERLFDEVLVAEQETGRVIFEQGSRGLNVVTLDSLLNSKGGKLELKLADQSSSLVDVQVAGTDYKLFLQPVRLTLSASTDEKKQEVRWVVCGLTRTDHFRDATFAVSYTVLIIFMFVVLLAVLSWPLLKLKLMGPKDRLRRVDLGLTLFSSLMGMALVTFILLDMHTYIGLENTLDQQLEGLSQGIKSNFQKELASALFQLRKLNKKMASLWWKEEQSRNPGLKDSAPATPPDFESISSTPSLSRKINILGDGLDWDWKRYPYFNSATWTDSAGQQRIKWTTWRDTTALIKVFRRQFFKNAEDGKLWKLSGPRRDFEYSMEMVTSNNTGDNVVVIATSVPTKVPGPPWVSSLDTKLLSLMGPVLPAGYGFAVVDSSKGRVLFHSDEVKNLEEQFFAECENDRWLRAAVLSRANRHIDTQYLGKGYRMYVSALDGTPWTLVVFVDKQIARTMNLEVITLSFVLYLLFVLSVVALISIVALPRMLAVFSGRYFRKQADGSRWLWPDKERAPQYELLILSYVLITCIFVIVLKETNEWLLATFCMGFPLLAALLWWLIVVEEPDGHAVQDKPGDGRKVPFHRKLYKSVLALIRKVYRKLYEGALASLKKKNIIGIRSLSYRTRYAIAFAGLLALSSVLPAVGFFKLAQNFESTLMVKHGQVSIVRALEQRAQRVASLYAPINIGDQAAFVERRLDHWPGNPNLDVYDTFFFGTKRVNPPQAQPDENTQRGLDRLLLWFRPLYNQTCVESQGLAAGAPSDGLWRSHLDSEGDIFLVKDKDGRRGEPSFALKSSIPAIVAPNTFLSWLRVIGLLALVVLLIYALVRFVARRFFLLDVELPRCIDLPLPTDLIKNYVLLRSPKANGDEWDCKICHVTDLRSVKVWSDWTEGLRSKSAGLPVVLHNFEHCMDDPAANREKLLAIEHLLISKRRVLVVTTVDPLSFSLTPTPAGEVAANNDKIETVPSEPVSIEGQQNGAADLKVEYHSSVPFSVAIEGQQNGAAEVNGHAPVPYLPPTDVQTRWTELFTNFATVCAPDKSSAEFAKDSDFVVILKTEAPWRYIEEIVNRIQSVQNGTLAKKDGRDRAKIEELISEVVEQAQPYHQSLWKTCSEGQRCTLIQLAQDGMLCPKNKHLRRLVKRGLIVRDPGLRLMDESFRRFVISVSHEQDVEGWRQQEGGSAWQLLRAPLLLILVSVALFLFITQKDVYDSTISFMSAITAGIAALFRLLGMFNGKDKGAGSIQS